MANEANKPEAPRAQTPTEVVQANERVIAKRNAESSAVAEKSTGFVVTPGKSLATPRGIVSEGQAISVLDFEDEKFFRQRQEEGYIVAEGKAK
ncbi:MAG: hypothetical protein IPP12_22655 [Nitrospira sp.]|nr:hypothetical protein [Nitrospira sp.]